MSKVKTLTPVHVGNGNIFYIAEIINKTVYTLDDVLSCIDYKHPQYNKIIEILQNNKNLSKTDFVRNFAIDKSLLLNIKKDNTFIYKMQDNIKGNFFETQKDLNNTIIPGSTLKGYFENVLFFDIIYNNNEIRKYISNKLLNIYNNYSRDFHSEYKEESEKNKILKIVNKEIDRVWKNIYNQVKETLCLIGFRDIYFNNNIALYEATRYDKYDKSLPVGGLETIPMNSFYEGEFYYTLYETSANLVKDKLDYIKENISKNDNEQLKTICFEFVKEIDKRLSNFKDWFVDANRNFMTNILDFEYDYIIKLKNSKVDIITLKQVYLNLKNSNQNAILMQVGKATNYMIKTVGLAFKEFYYEHFDLLFAPDAPKLDKMKKSANISMMTLVNKYKKGIMPLGFIEVIL